MERLLAIIMILNVGMGTFCQAQQPRLLTVPVSQETEQLKELLAACDDALTKCDQVVAQQGEITRIQAEMIDGQAKRIGDLEASQSGIMNNKLVWLAVGFIIGGVSFSLLKR